MAIELPASGRNAEDVFAEMEAMRGRDLDWRQGRHGAFVWYADEALEEVLQSAYSMFMVENGLGIRVFPSLARMEDEVLAMVRWLLSADDDAAGIFTSGGTESVFLAMCAAREWALAAGRGGDRPSVIAAHSAHPAVDKAGHYLGLEVIRVPVGVDYRADPAAIEKAINERTIALYASAPAYSLGVVDPVAALGEIAVRHDLWLHVDACVGGVLTPFVRQLGYDVPPFDFAVPGVRSVSADLHKSGFTAKPASTLTFRTSELREFARFTHSNWTGGTFSILTFTGTRPGGAIAAAWAAFNYLGQDGYRGLAASAMRAKEAVAGGVSQIRPLSVFGSPDLWAFAYGSSEIDMPGLARLMYKRGWLCPPTTSPRGIHVMCTPVHEATAQQYVSDVAECVEELRDSAVGRGELARYN